MIEFLSLEQDNQNPLLGLSSGVVIIKPQKSVEVYSPATVANLGAGFDCLGLALNDIGEYAFSERSNHANGIESIVQVSGCGSTELNRLGQENIYQKALELVAHLTGLQDVRLHINVKRNFPLSSGLGSSAAASSNAAKTICHLLRPEIDKFLSKRCSYEAQPKNFEEFIVALALSLENHLSAGLHADNLISALTSKPALSNVWSEGKGAASLSFRHIEIRQPTLCISVVTPTQEISTADSRRGLAKSVELRRGCAQMYLLSRLVLALSSEADLTPDHFRDLLATPARKTTIDGYDAITKSLGMAGAICSGISGSGPSIFSIWNNYDEAIQGLLSLSKKSNKNGIKFFHLESIDGEKSLTIDKVEDCELESCPLNLSVTTGARSVKP